MIQRWDAYYWSLRSLKVWEVCHMMFIRHQLSGWCYFMSTVYSKAIRSLVLFNPVELESSLALDSLSWASKKLCILGNLLKYLNKLEQLKSRWRRTKFISLKCKAQRWGTRYDREQKGRWNFRKEIVGAKCNYTTAKRSIS